MGILFQGTESGLIASFPRARLRCGALSLSEACPMDKAHISGAGKSSKLGKEGGYFLNSNLPQQTENKNNTAMEKHCCQEVCV